MDNDNDDAPVCFPGRVDGALVLLEVDKCDGQLGKVGDVVVEELGRLVHLAAEAPVSDLLDVGVVGAGDELLEVGEPRRLGVRVDQL